MAVILLVAVTVSLSAVIGTFTLDLGNGLSDSSAEHTGQVATKLSSSSDGVSVQLLTSGSADTVKVLKNGTEVGTINSVGGSVSVNTSDSENAEVSIIAVSDGTKTVVETYESDEVSATSSTTQETVDANPIFWGTTSDWDNYTSQTGVQHSTLVGSSDKVRLGTAEEDGDVTELNEDFVSGTSSSVQSTTVKRGSYAYKIVTDSSGDSNYDTLYDNRSTPVKPDKTIFWLHAPNPNSGDWIYKTAVDGPNSTGDVVPISSVGFDGTYGGTSETVALLNASSGWTGGGNYPHKTWTKVTLDWDWANEEVTLYIDGQKRATEGFRNSVSGITSIKHYWDHRYSNSVTGYLDFKNTPYADKGSLTTANKTFETAVKPDLTNLSYTQNGESINVTVTGSPGTASEESHTVQLDGASQYNISWSNEHKNFRITTEVRSANRSETPIIDEIELSP